MKQYSKNRDRFQIALVLAPVALFLAGGLGLFGSNCQQLIVDMTIDMRSEHVIIHD